LSVQLVSKISNLCDHKSPTSQTDRQTDRRHAMARPRFALCIVHRAVKTVATCCVVTRWLPEYNNYNCISLSTIQTNATRRMEWVYYSNKLAVQYDFREFDGRPISLGYIHWTFGLRAHTVKFCLWWSRFALHIVKQYFAECGLRNANNV